MKRCGWCKQRVWPWQRARTYGRHTLHVRCSRIIYQMTLRDEEEVRSV